TTDILRLASSVVAHNESRLGKELFSRRGGGKKPVLAFLPNQDEEAAFCADLIEKSVSAAANAAAHAFADVPGGRKNGDPAGSSRWADWAVLYRTNAQSLGFETEFLRRGIPYRVVGTLKFYEREEIKDALALLSFLANGRDEIAFRRVINKPARGLGKATVDRIIEAFAGDLAAAPEPGGLETAARLLLPDLPPKARTGLQEFLKLMEEGRDLIAAGGVEEDGEAPTIARSSTTAKSHGTSPAVPAAKSRPILNSGLNSGPNSGPGSKPGPGPGKGRKARREEVSESRDELRGSEGLSTLVVKLVTDSGLADHYRLQEEVGAVPRLNNLQELANAAVEYPATMAGLLQFLENIELDRSLEDNSDKQTGSNAVTLITFHNTKGLEFRHVIMTGIEQGVFPRDDKKGEDLEEERRLFYVGATRAMDELYLVSCAQRRMYGRTQDAEPSLFLREIDPAVLRTIGARRGWSGSSGHVGLGHTGLSHTSLDHTGLGRPGHTGPGAEGDRARGEWQRGDRVYHDDYGYGGVVRVRESEEGPIVELLFESGKELRFLSRYQGSAFTRIGRDD
ncbi:MAG: ATP-dependent helicase, partial [Treponema sp.]|nr:ATP-dependent helicase [Treponema sp.]